MKPWDLGPGILLVREAGGRVADYDGGDRMVETGTVCAAGPALHARLMAVLAEVRAAGQPRAGQASPSSERGST